MSLHPKDVDTVYGIMQQRKTWKLVCVAVVTEDPRLVLIWRGKEIVDISRAFLDTNGAHQETDVSGGHSVPKDNYCIKSLDKLQEDRYIPM
ncbi:MAG: hypothetical protein ACLTDV_13510 [Eubacterium sp.]